MRVAAVGMSFGGACGVRDHATLLAEALNRATVACSIHWLSRGDVSFRPARREIRQWTQRLTAELEHGQPDAILLHYSVFAYAHRGIPLFVHLVTSAVRRSRIPLITVLHEFAYPWMHRGVPGAVWASSQRALLFDIMCASSAAVVTTDDRAEWLGSRRWLPKRPVLVSPVFSNLPPPATAVRAGPQPYTLGLFGYSGEHVAISLVLDALSLLKEDGIRVQLMLLGAPGRLSPAADAWLSAAEARGLDAALEFSGTLPAQELSDALAANAVLLFTDGAGPSSRKGTLAASLASGRPVVAADGPDRWSELVTSGAARVVPPAPRPLADAIYDLLAGERLREALGRRGREFAERRMSVGHAAQVVTALAHEVVDRRS